MQFDSRYWKNVLLYISVSAALWVLITATFPQAPDLISMAANTIHDLTKPQPLFLVFVFLAVLCLSYLYTRIETYARRRSR